MQQEGLHTTKLNGLKVTKLLHYENVVRNMRCYQTKHSRNFLSKERFSYRFCLETRIRNFSAESKIPDCYFFYRDQTHLQRQFKTISLTCFLLSFMRLYWSVSVLIESRENWWVSSVKKWKIPHQYPSIFDVTF